MPPPFRRFPFLSCNFRKNSAFSFKRQQGPLLPLAYARLMAGSLFPQYGRIVYLDADVLLAGDVAELYFPICGELP